MRNRATLCLVAVVLTAAGCGDGADKKSADEKQVRALLSQLEALSREGNGQAICDTLFTPKLVASVERAAKSHNCAREVRKNVFTPSAVVTVRSIDLVDDLNGVAHVTVQNGIKDVVYVVKNPQSQWRIRSIQREE